MSKKSPLIRQAFLSKGDFLDSKSGSLQSEKTGGIPMKGYYTSDGFWGYFKGKYVLFSCEADYYEMIEDEAA